MQTRSGFSTKSAFFLWALCILSLARAQQRPQEQKAKQILEATGVKGGLVVHIGCGNGRLTAALRANDSYLVHGLDADMANVEKAREYMTYCHERERARMREHDDDTRETKDLERFVRKGMNPVQCDKPVLAAIG